MRAFDWIQWHLASCWEQWMVEPKEIVLSKYQHRILAQELMPGAPPPKVEFADPRTWPNSPASTGGAIVAKVVSGVTGAPIPVRVVG